MRHSDMRHSDMGHSDMGPGMNLSREIRREIRQLSRTIDRHVTAIRKLARDGMLASAVAMLVLVIFTHPHGETRWALVLGLACFTCSRISQGRPAARRPSAARTGTRRPPYRRQAEPGRRRQYSPECMRADCGSCSGAGCGHGCGHPGRARRKTTVPDDADLDDAEIPF